MGPDASNNLELFHAVAHEYVDAAASLWSDHIKIQGTLFTPSDMPHRPLSPSISDPTQPDRTLVTIPGVALALDAVCGQARFPPSLGHEVSETVTPTERGEWWWPGAGDRGRQTAAVRQV